MVLKGSGTYYSTKSCRVVSCHGDVINFNSFHISADSRPTDNPKLIQSSLTKTHALVQWLKLKACTAIARLLIEQSSSRSRRIT